MPTAMPAGIHPRLIAAAPPPDGSHVRVALILGEGARPQAECRTPGCGWLGYPHRRLEYARYEQTAHRARHRTSPRKPS